MLSPRDVGRAAVLTALLEDLVARARHRSAPAGDLQVLRIARIELAALRRCWRVLHAMECGCCGRPCDECRCNARCGRRCAAPRIRWEVGR